MASRFDSWGNVALEALAAGRPLVCTTGTGVSELVGRLDPAAIAPVDDPPGWPSLCGVTWFPQRLPPT